MNTAAQEYQDQLEHQLEDAQEEVHRLAEQRDELLDSVIDLTGLIEGLLIRRNWDGSSTGQVKSTLREAHAIIAKVRGQQP